MILQQLFRFSSIFRSALSAQLNRNIGFSAIAFNKAKELDPVQKLFLDKIREYKTKSHPDQNPIENLGSNLKRAVHRKCLHNLAGFERFLKEGWAKIPKAKCAMLLRQECLLTKKARVAKYKDVHLYSTTLLKAGGPVDVGPEYEKELNDQTEKLTRVYGGGDMTKFPEFKFEEPKFDEVQK